MKKKICVITGARSDYGLLRGVMHEIKNDLNLELQIIATGMHLSPEFGLTFVDIEQDGFLINRKLEILLSSDTPVGIAKSMGLGLIGFADALNELKPNLVLVVGDRFEIFSAVSAALVACIPVAHLHGGEITSGAFDDSLRHSITKMAHLHFVATEDYRKRVIQLGELPSRVFLVGGLGIDNIKRLNLLNRDEIETSLGFSFGEKNLLITFHPVTLEHHSAGSQINELLNALAGLKDTRLIFTLPNADTNGRVVIEAIRNFVANNLNASVFTSLGQLLYISIMAQVDGLVGNSSSGLLEAPSFKKGVINIGTRQSGRLQAGNVINCEPTAVSIGAALERLYSSKFQDDLFKVENPYGDGGASVKIVKIINNYSFDGLIRKNFYDLSVEIKDIE